MARSFRLQHALAICGLLYGLPAPCLAAEATRERPDSDELINALQGRFVRVESLRGLFTSREWFSDSWVERVAAATGRTAARSEDLAVVRFAVREPAWAFETLQVVCSGSGSKWGGRTNPVPEHKMEVTHPPSQAQRYDVCDGETVFIYNADTGQGRLLAAGPTQRKSRLNKLYAYLGLYLTPFAESPSDTFRACDRIEVLDRVELDGERCLRVTAHRPVPDGHGELTFWLAIDKGYAPVRSEQLSLWAHEPGRGTRIVMQFRELAEVAPELWLPMRAVEQIYTYAADRDEPWLKSSELIFQRLEANQPLADCAFRLQFPLGTLVTDARNNQRWIEGSPRRALHDFQHTVGPPPPLEAEHAEPLTGEELDKYRGGKQ